MLDIAKFPEVQNAGELAVTFGQTQGAVANIGGWSQTSFQVFIRVPEYTLTNSESSQETVTGSLYLSSDTTKSVSFQFKYLKANDPVVKAVKVDGVIVTRPSGFMAGGTSVEVEILNFPVLDTAASVANGFVTFGTINADASKAAVYI